jgi:hypothetical protein
MSWMPAPFIMQQSKQLWRASLFVILLAALCGSLAFPLVNPPVNAAPRMQVAASIVISEFRTRGPNGAADEFIELYNPTSGSFSIDLWKFRLLYGK